MADVDRVTETFVGKNIFITGGSGFIGKVLIEKILRLCPDVGSIYVLIRPKKGKDPQTRIRELMANPLFDKMKSMHGADFGVKKCRVIEGDVAEINLGIKDEDRKLLIENINYIYHIAATVRFDAPLKGALLMNTRGTKFMLQLAKECNKLELFCYVSTAYVNPNVKVVEEKAYPPSVDPHQTIQSVEALPSDAVDLITPTILGNLPNTYTLTKSLSEALVVEQMDSLPVIIVRPSVVVPMWKEPIPGWGENINGPMGLLIGAGKGVVRSMYCHANYYADFMPVDVAVNGICLTTWDYLTHKNKDRRIFNFTSSDEIQISWQRLINAGKKIATTTVPFNYMLWYPGGGLRTSKIVHYIAVLLFQMIPAIFIDALLFCLGQKPLLINIQKRIWNGSKLLEFYTSHQWTFVKNNLCTIRSMLTEKEWETYYVYTTGFDLEDFVAKAILGARRFVLKEPDNTLPAAKRHLMMMWIVDILFKVLIVGTVVYYCFKGCYDTFYT